MSVATFDSRATVRDVLEHLERHGPVQELTCRSALGDAGLEALLAAALGNRRLLASLRVLRLPANQLSSGALPGLARLLQAAPQLRHVDLSENSLGDAGHAHGLEPLVDVFAGPDAAMTCLIEFLDLRHNRIGPKGGPALARLLRDNRSLRALSLAQNALGTKTVKAVAAALRHNTTLHRLDLSYNKLSDRGLSFLVAAVLDPGSDCALERLDLQYNKIGPAGAAGLARALLEQGSNYRHLTHLNLSLNCIGPEGAQALGGVLKYSHVLRHLDLGRNDIGSGVLPLLQGLSESQVTTLRLLDLSWNSLTDDAAVFLAERVLVTNSHLEVLNLSSNAIGDRGVLALARALAADMGLKELDIIGNQARDESAFALADVLTSQHCLLQTLKWEKNNFTHAGKMRLRAALAYRHSLHVWLEGYLKEIATRNVVAMDFSNQRIGDYELIAICRALAKHKPRVPTIWLYGDAKEQRRPAVDSDNERGNLQFITSRGMIVLANEVLAKNSSRVERIYVDSCLGIGDDGWAALAEALRTNRTVIILSLTRSKMSLDAVHSLASALERNDTLQRLSLCENKLGDPVVAELVRSVNARRVRSPLKSINLSRNEISDVGMASLPTIGANLCLQELHLAGNNITDVGVLDLAKACVRDTSLEWVNLSQNQISCRGKRALKLFLPSNAILEADEQRC